MAGLEVHTIPFWTVVYSWTQKSEMVSLDPDGDEYFPQLQHTNFSFSTSAVAPGHWAHGVILDLDILRINRGLRLGRLVAREHTDLWPNTPPPTMNDMIWDAATAPKFARGYPRLSEVKIERLAKLSSLSETRSGTRTVIGVTDNIVGLVWRTFGGHELIHSGLGPYHHIVSVHIRNAHSALIIRRCI